MTFTIMCSMNKVRARRSTSPRCRLRKILVEVTVLGEIFTLIFHAKNFNWLFNSINETLFG